MLYKWSSQNVPNRIDQLTQTGVTYEVVSNIPKASEELEERESLAQIAATGEEASAADGETYIGMSILIYVFTLYVAYGRVGVEL